MSKLEMVLKENVLKDLILHFFRERKIENVDEYLQRKIISSTTNNIFDELIDANMREWGFILIDDNLIISLIPKKIEIIEFVSFPCITNESVKRRDIERGILLQFQDRYEDSPRFFESIINFRKYVLDTLDWELSHLKLI